MNHRRGGLCLLITAIAFGVGMPTASADSVATIVTMNGPAEIEKDGTTVVGVNTGPDTTVVVQVDATHDVTVYQNTQLRLGEVLDLRVGTVRVRGSLIVATANAQSSVRASEMTVAFDDQSGITTIEVTDREATVRGNNDVADQVVPAGQMVRVGTDGITTTAQAISPVEITAARTAPPGDRTTDRERALPYLVMIAAFACLLVGVGGLAGSKRSRPAPTPA